jgi:predicted nuclease of predicted toxin-antitoxin system
MKLLLDQNISYKLVKQLEEYFPESSHLKFENLTESDDFEIWQFAKDNNFTIVTQDVDFSEISFLRGIPPKIIWLKFGNTTSQYIFETLIINFNSIVNFINEPNSSCLQLY